MTTKSVRLQSPASEMAREEISKQVAFLSKSITNVRFSEDGTCITFDADAGESEGLQASVQQLGNRVARALRSLQRKIVFSSAAAADPKFSTAVRMDGVHFMGNGQVALAGLPLRLFNYFDRMFEAFGRPWQAAPCATPTLIPTKTLSRCDYFRSFPQNVTFASHLREDGDVIDAFFRARHQTAYDADDHALADMERPEACLSPAVCYHVYRMHQDETLTAAGLVYGICGKCFRYESSNLSDLRRLWDFTMREVVFLGTREDVLAKREKSMNMMAEFLDAHQLAGEIRTASDPFFVAPDAVSKTYFQLSSDSKFEVSLMLPDGERTAVGSHNYHSDFFGRVFHTDIAGAGAMHSVCVAFGLERWVYAFLQQHGSDPGQWPEPMRGAPEFRARRMEYRSVDGAAFAVQASELLQGAWRPPSLLYSPEYLKWQLSFPGPYPVPAIAAFDGSTPAGFAASVHRRVRYGAAAFDAVIVSFVGVHVDFRNCGIAAGLYQHLLATIREREIPVITYANAGSAGERAIERAYPSAGLVLHSLGSFPVYGFAVRREADVGAWASAAAGEEPRVLRDLIDGGIAGEARICSDPSLAQVEHYLHDPRGRKLLIERNNDGDTTGAAWAVQVEHRGVNGNHSVITIDCAWLARERAQSLPGLAAAAARLWQEPEAKQPVIVQALSLGGVDPAAARQVGFRQIATPFHGYVAVAGAEHPVCEARGSNLEVV